ncbi:MAG: HAMP domain-containing protein [Alphaproteobacteria bacterium]|nr:HAMP domain-containing protein [Alphaproteobacteria bacterium]
MRWALLWLAQRRASTSLTRRILAINLLVLIVPIGSFFFLDQYQQSLIDSEIAALRTQGEVFAGAVGAGAVGVSPGIGQRVEPVRANLMLRRLTDPTNTRARLFVNTGVLVADTQYLTLSRGFVQVQELPPPLSEIGFDDWLDEKISAVLNWLPGNSELPLYEETSPSNANNYVEVQRALFGEQAAAVRRQEAGGMVISVAVPVQRYRQVVGALMLTTSGVEVEKAMRAIRLDILQVFAIALGVTILLSLYLAGTIARPINRLAAAAERVRTGRGRHAVIPDFSGRRDEIGELSRDLRGMTEALWQRMDAIERFAADVAHEIKNPLTSLRSAVETVARVDDPEQQKRLMSIIVDDVHRLDRLISDISDASRLDAELSRDVPTPIDVRQVLGALTDIERSVASDNRSSIDWHLEADTDLTVCASESRLGQVFRNIIANAISFSPTEKNITVRAERVRKREGDVVTVSVEDDGPGIPPENLESIFERFYSDRPIEGPDGKGEKFGTHSGLGLSISRQIVEAADGRIWAENRRNGDGVICGARFVVELPTGARD